MAIKLTLWVNGYCCQGGRYTCNRSENAFLIETNTVVASCVFRTVIISVVRAKTRAADLLKC